VHTRNILNIAITVLLILAGFLPGAPARAQDDPNQPISPVATNPPGEDGSISHVVEYGETLIMIANAYGVPLSELISINKLDPNNPAIFEGQPLLIRVAFTVTPFITTTFTPRPPTRTPLPSRTPRPTRTPTPDYSPTPTRTATREPLVRIPTLEEVGPARPLLAYAAFGISLIALVALVVSVFLPGGRK
jgi:LysM repeat protein